MMTLLVFVSIWTQKQKQQEGFNKRLLELISFAKVKKWYDKENPASWQEHLGHVLPDPIKFKRSNIILI